MSNITIRKIHVSADGAKIAYDLGESSVVLAGTTAPAPAFSKALAELAPHVVRMLSLPAKYGETMTITGAVFAAKADGETVVITADKILRPGDSEFRIATPLRYMTEPLADPDASPAEVRASASLCVDDVLRELLSALREQAEKYVRTCPEMRQLYLPLAETGT